MPFVQRTIEPKYLSRTSLWDEDGKPRVTDNELEAVTNNTLSNALRQLASLVLVANDIFGELSDQLQSINKRSDALKVKIRVVEEKVAAYDPKKVTVPESDICSFALFKDHFTAKYTPETNLFTADTRPQVLKELYETANKTPIHLMRQMDRWRRDGCRTSRFFMCTPILGTKRRRMRNKIDIDIETSMPAIVKELRKWTSSEAIGDIAVTPDCPNRLIPNVTLTNDAADGTTITATDDEAIDHTLPSPEEQLQVMALKFPAEIIAVDISGRTFNRMSSQRRSLLPGDLMNKTEEDPNAIRKRTRSRKPRSRRRNTLAGTDQKEIRDALTAGEEPCTSSNNYETETSTIGAVCRSKSSDLLRSNNKKESPNDKKSHFNTLKQWGKNRYDRLMSKCTESKTSDSKKQSSSDDIDDFNIYETVTMKRKRSTDKERRTHERNPSISSSEKSSVNLPISSPLTSVMNIAVKLRDSSAQRRQRRAGTNKDEPHSSSGNWSASSESGRASIGSEFTSTTVPKSTTSAATSSNSLNQAMAPNSVNSRRRFNVNASASSSITSEGTLTPDIIHDLHEDGETSSIYSCDTEGYYTSFHMDSGLKTLKEEELPCTPLHSTSAFCNSDSNNTVLTAENEYELFGKGSTSTTTSSAGTVCTTLRASESNRSLNRCPAVPERKSSLNKKSETALEKDGDSDQTGTVKRSPATINKGNVISVIVHNETNGDVSPDSGHNTSSSPIESINSPNGVRSGSEFEFSESSDMEGHERTERIRIKTTINSSRIPSMCVITPPQSDDESVKSHNSLNNFNKQYANQGLKIADKSKLDLNLKTAENDVPSMKSSDSNKENYNIHTRLISTNNKVQLINVNPQSGYATVENVDNNDNTIKNPKVLRAPSPSGGSVTVNQSPSSKSPSQPIIKATLLPLNNMFGRLKTNLLTHMKRDSKSPNRNSEDVSDSGDYVTLADVRNNNEKSQLPPPPPELLYANNAAKQTIEKVKQQPTEYVSLDQLPCNLDSQQESSTAVLSPNNSLERKRRHGARVTLDAEGKVVYSSDSLKRRERGHTTFEPGPFVKASDSPTQSPLPAHRVPKAVRPARDPNRPLSPQLGKLVIRAISGSGGLTNQTEIVRVPGTTIVAPNHHHPTSPKPMGPRGAYVHIQDGAGSPTTFAQDNKEGVPSLSNNPAHLSEAMYNLCDVDDMEKQYRLENRYYFQNNSPYYQTLPLKRTQYLYTDAERSVTPDITRGLERHNTQSIDRKKSSLESDFLHHKLGIPVQMPQINTFQRVPSKPSANNYYTPIEPHRPPSYPQQPYQYISSPSLDDNNESLRISPIDPRNSTSFKSSTPSSKSNHELKAAAALNLENKLLSPKKSTMTNEELYAVIHKSKKKMNISTNENMATPLEAETKSQPKSPETGYLGDKSRSRLSWSPSKGEYVDFNQDIDKISPPNESRSRQSWACSDRKGTPQTSRLDFKKLLLQKSTNKPKKISAVEQLKLSKQNIQQSPQGGSNQSALNILELSGSPRSLVNRKFASPQGSPVRNVQEKQKAAPKLMSPRSQWRFANPRTDVLSSTILEDCREYENSNSLEKNKSASPQQTKTEVKNAASSSPNKNAEGFVENKAYMSLSQRLQQQRAQFFQSTNTKISQTDNKDNKCSVALPTLETAF